MNTNLTAANEVQVTKLVQDFYIKGLWQAKAQQFGKQNADRFVSNLVMLPVKTVKAARYYWE